MIKSLEVFLDNLNDEMTKAKISLKENWFIDHICYRAQSEAEYQNLCSEYHGKGELLIEAPVGGRLISTFKLHEPISFLNCEIPLVEIPMPKAGRVTPSGYEHIEIVAVSYTHLTLPTTPYV